MHSNDGHKICVMFLHDIDIAVHQFDSPIISDLLFRKLLGYHIEKTIDSVIEKRSMSSLAPSHFCSHDTCVELVHNSCKIDSIIKFNHFSLLAIPVVDEDVFF